MLLICFQAMKESGLSWPLITEDEQDKQLARYVATVKFGEDLSSSLQELAMKQYIENDPGPYLLAFVAVEIKAWLSRIHPEKTDNYIMLAAATFVNCIAFVPMLAVNDEQRTVGALHARQAQRQGCVVGETEAFQDRKAE